MSSNMSIMSWRVRAEQLIKENEINRDAPLHMKDGTLFVSGEEQIGGLRQEGKFKEHTLVQEKDQSVIGWLKKKFETVGEMFATLRSGGQFKSLGEHKVTQEKFTEALKDKFGSEFVGNLSQKPIDDEVVTPSTIIKTFKEAEELKSKEVRTYLEEHTHLFSPNEELFSEFIGSESGKEAIEMYAQEMIYDS